MRRRNGNVRSLNDHEWDVQAEYSERDPYSRSYAWHPLSPLSIAYRHCLERALRPVLCSLPELSEMDVLDVGCGIGQHLRWFVEQGANVRRLHGVDVLKSRVERSLASNPALDVQLAAADHLPFAASSFDLVTQFTAFSSMKRSTRKDAVGEITRVARPGSTMIWFDVKRPNPTFPDGVPLADVEGLFAGWDVVTARSLCSRLLPRVAGSALASALVEAVPIARTNLLIVFRRQPRARE